MACMAEGHGIAMPIGPERIKEDSAFHGKRPLPFLNTLSITTAPPPPEVIGVFADHVIRRTAHRPTAPAWWRPLTYRRFGGRCAYCDRALAAQCPFSIDHLIPPSVGGPHHAHAVVLCCRKCKRAKAGRDLLMWQREPNPHVQATRFRLALEAHNHCVLSESGKRQRTDEVLMHRWHHARFACHLMRVGNGALIGWARPRDAPMSAYMCLTFEHHAQACASSRLSGATPVIYWVPGMGDGHRVLRDLIQLNAWVLPISPSNPKPASGDLPAWLFTTQGRTTRGDVGCGVEADLGGV